MTSNPVKPAFKYLCANPSSVTAASIDGTAAKAVSLAAGRGYIFMVAPVMMPSVPSAPMNKSRRS